MIGHVPELDPFVRVFQVDDVEELPLLVSQILDGLFVLFVSTFTKPLAVFAHRTGLLCIGTRAQKGFRICTQAAMGEVGPFPMDCPFLCPWVAFASHERKDVD